MGHIDFVGCDANVDLDRLLTRLSQAAIPTSANQLISTPCCNNLQMLCIRFPDPHFKARHAKRRVVTPRHVTSLARFMPLTSRVVFCNRTSRRYWMRCDRNFDNSPSIFETQGDPSKNIYQINVVGIPTEREVSVLEQNLPVYRALFTRTEQEFSMACSKRKQRRQDGIFKKYSGFTVMQGRLHRNLTTGSPNSHLVEVELP